MTVYFCGDLHGEHALLMSTLQGAGFKFNESSNQPHDRLICTGDLIDRGPDSAGLLDLFRTRPEFDSVMGNHEELALKALLKQGKHFARWLHNGGDWAATMCDDELHMHIAWTASLPLATEYVAPNGMKVGVVHAGVPTGMHWDDFYVLCQNITELTPQERVALRKEALWDREKFKARHSTPVQGVDFLICGHNVHKERPLVCGNTIYLDTGACRDKGNLSLLRVNPNGNFLGNFDLISSAQD